MKALYRLSLLSGLICMVSSFYKEPSFPQEICDIVLRYVSEIKAQGTEIECVYLEVEDSSHFILGVPNDIFQVREDLLRGVVSLNGDLSIAFYCSQELSTCEPWNRIVIQYSRVAPQNKNVQSLINWQRYELFEGRWIQMRYDPVLDNKETVIFEEDDVKVVMSLPEEFALYSDGKHRYITFYGSPQRFVYLEHATSIASLITGSWRRVENQIVMNADFCFESQRTSPYTEDEINFQECAVFPGVLIIEDDKLIDDTVYSDFIQSVCVDSHFITREFKKVPFCL